MFGYQNVETSGGSLNTNVSPRDRVKPDVLNTADFENTTTCFQQTFKGQSQFQGESRGLRGCENTSLRVENFATKMQIFFPAKQPFLALWKLLRFPAPGKKWWCQGENTKPYFALVCLSPEFQVREKERQEHWVHP